MPEDIPDRLASVLARVQTACRACHRDPETVRVIAVSKRQPLEKIRACYDAGHRDFGENYVQELEKKRKQLPSDIRWHMIGHLQRNKAKHLYPVTRLHTVDSVRLLKPLGQALPEGCPRFRVLAQVNVAEEPSKAGLLPHEVESFLEASTAFPKLAVVGLMAIPPAGQGAQWFSELRTMRANLATRTGLELPELSMGMSRDFEEAIRAGATWVRVGTAIFGPRD